MALFKKCIDSLAEVVGGGRATNWHKAYDANKGKSDEQAHAERIYKQKAQVATELGQRADHFTDNEIKPNYLSHEEGAKHHKIASDAHHRAAAFAKAAGDNESAKYHQSKAHEHFVNHDFHKGKSAEHRANAQKAQADREAARPPQAHPAQPAGDDSHDLYKPHTGPGLPHWLGHAKTHRDAKLAFRQKAMELHPDRENDPAMKAKKEAAFKNFHADWEKAQKHPSFPQPTNEDVMLESFLVDFDLLAFD